MEPAEGQAESNIQEKPVNTLTAGSTLYIQDGGTFLDKGYYGCIFQPALICKGRSNPFKRGRLGKLTGKEDMANEMRAALHFKNVPVAKKYIILPHLDTLCVPKPIAKQKEKELDKCTPIERVGYTEMQHYEMDYGGVTLNSRLQTIKDKFSYDALMLRMLEIGSFLTLNGIVHNDLHLDNILVNKNFVPRLIDFGRCIVVKDIGPDMMKELLAKYMPELGQIPPESSAQDGINEDVPFSRILNDLRRVKPGLIYAERYLGLSRSKQLAEFKAFWESSRSIQQGDWVTFLKMYWSVIDSWSIGALLLGILHRLLIYKSFVDSSEWKSIQMKVRTVLRGLLRASPRERLDCVEALALYDPTNDLITGDIGRAWLDKREKTRARLG